MPLSWRRGDIDTPQPKGAGILGRWPRSANAQRPDLLNLAGAKNSRGQISRSARINDPGSGVPHRTQGSF
ncbi:MAG: hypothetical protein F6K55_38955 [Moorea sp. SIO4A3]|nr:hypothetical protein [Moorena sp. SIO4A3]